MTIHLESSLSEDAVGQALAVKVRERDAAIREQMSPPGALGLPPLLEQRRLDYGLVDGEFEHQATYDRVFVHQLDYKFAGGETFVKGGKIIRSEAKQSADENEAPRGIIVSAGLKALDILRSNGMDLGHIVNFQRLAPARFEVAKIQGIARKVLVFVAGDIMSSEDTATMLRNEDLLRLIYEDGQHRYINPREKHAPSPVIPWQPDEY